MGPSFAILLPKCGSCSGSTKTAESWKEWRECLGYSCVLRRLFFVSHILGVFVALVVEVGDYLGSVRLLPHLQLHRFLFYVVQQLRVVLVLRLWVCVFLVC